VNDHCKPPELGFVQKKIKILGAIFFKHAFLGILGRGVPSAPG